MGSCFHCSEPTRGAGFSETIAGHQRSFCCLGCQEICKSIFDQGLEDYYKYRTAPGEKYRDWDQSTFQELALLDQEVEQDDNSGEERKTLLSIQGMQCAACAWLIEKKLLQQAGINRISVNSTTCRATVQWDPQQLSLAQIIKRIKAVGYEAFPFQPDKMESGLEKEKATLLKRIGLSGLLAMQVMMLAFGLYFGVFGNISEDIKIYFHWASMLVTLPIVIYGGTPFYKGAVSGLKLKHLNMDVSITIAILLTYIASSYATVSQSGEIYFESVGMLIFLLLLGRFLDLGAKLKALQMTANVQRLLPKTARKVAEGNLKIVAVSTINVGDIVRVLPGETISVDGKIVSGQSQINESMLSGESIPVSRSSSDNVYAGSNNISQSIDIEVTTIAQNSMLNQIVMMQEDALTQKNKITEKTDKFSQWFVALVLAITVICSIVWYYIDPSQVIWIAVAILVATCPCALSLATPTAVTCASSVLYNKGVMLKSQNALLDFCNAQNIAFDKTGTLTTGEFEIIQTKASDEEFVLALAAGLEAHSQHPIASAFKSYTPLAVTDVEAINHGIQGKYLGQSLVLGNYQCVDKPKVSNHFLYLTMDNRELAIFELQESLRPEVTKVLSWCSNHFSQLQLLTGDPHVDHQQWASILPFTAIHSACSPNDKVDYIEALKLSGSTIMVGDGINDAPVLSHSDVSIAVDAASDISKQGSDLVLLNSSLEVLPQIWNISKVTNEKIKQNLWWALGYNLSILPLAVTGLLSPWIAALGMSLSSVAVISNSLRIFKQVDR